MNRGEAEDFAARHARVCERIRTAEARYGRAPGSVVLLAVSKGQPAGALVEALAAGVTRFGENYVQEAVDKMTSVASSAPRDPRLEWHFIGPLQTNKAAAVAERFDWMHSVDRLRIAERLARLRAKHREPLNVCVQVNVSGEVSKAGVEPEAVAELAHSITGLPGLRLRGLMTLPAPSEDPSAQRVPFQRLRECFEALNHEGLALDTLSMGMSSDLEAAIAEGSTLVRIGTALFGARR